MLRVKIRIAASLVLLNFMYTNCGPGPDRNTENNTAGIPSLIPAPQIMNISGGSFLLTPATSINFSSGLEPEAILLKEYLDPYIDLDLKSGPPAPIGIGLSVEPSKEHTDEAYTLVISADRGVQLIGTTRKGVARGIQALRQIMMLAEPTDAGVVFPGLTIRDAPSFPHRGMLFDPCRHFFSKEVVKKYIDLLALYKMNTLHWHLTEDQGWRIQIDKYPKLTEVGAWRKDSTGTYGGFYTKRDIHEIVRYAQQRHIRIIPEIELPGHSQAAIAAYPNLSCTGEQVEVANEWGVFKEIYCAGNDSVFTFLEDVLTEVMDLFPGEFIHIGGDEAPKARWEQCPKCQHRIKEEGLKDEQELQSWFIRRIEKFLADHGRTLIGWDEILEGGLPETAVVQSWRGMEGGIEAAKHGNRVIMSPTSHCYLDYGLDATDMEEVYAFDPIPEALTPDQEKLVLGGECNLWSEHIPTEDELDRKTFPRLLAMAEVLWSYPMGKNYEQFKRRVHVHHDILKKLNVNFGLETVPVEFKLTNDPTTIRMTQRVDGVKVRWTNGGSPPTASSDLMGTDIPLIGQMHIKALAFRDGEAIDGPIEFKAENHLAISATYTVDTTYNKWYTGGGDSALTDGVLGTINFRDGRWQGYWGMPVQIELDLGKVHEVSQIGANFYHYPNAWILMPVNMRIDISTNGDEWTVLWNGDPRLTATNTGQHVKWMGSELLSEPLSARFIRLKATPQEQMPSWHEAAGEPVWTFIDEVIVR